MTIPTVTPALQLLDHAARVGRVLAAACDRLGLVPRSVTISAVDYAAERGRATAQLDTVDQVDAIAGHLLLDEDDPTNEYATRRDDGLPTLYSREGVFDGVTLKAFCRRPA